MSKTPEQKVADADINLAVIGLGVIVTTIASIVMLIRDGTHPVLAVVFSIIIVPPLTVAILSFTNLSTEDRQVIEAREKIEREELEDYLLTKRVEA